METAIKTWNETAAAIYKTIFQSPQKWNPDVWDMVRNINAALTIFAVALTVCIFFFGMVKKGVDLKEITKPEVAFSILLRLAIAVGLVSISMDLFVNLIEIVQGLMSIIAGTSGENNIHATLPEAVLKASDEASILDGSIEILLVSVLVWIAMFVISIILTIMVWGRFINIFIHIAVGGCFLATVAAENTMPIAASFIKSFLNSLFQAIIVILALVIYSKLLSSNSYQDVENAYAAGEYGDAIMLYAKTFFVGAILTITTCKGADALASKMGL